MSKTDFRHDIVPGSVGIATVRGVPNVVVLRRQTSAGRDWAHTLTAGYTCSHDDEVQITSTCTPYGLARTMGNREAAEALS